MRLMDRRQATQRVLLLKGATIRVVLPDVMFLALFAAALFAGSVKLFRRTL